MVKFQHSPNRQAHSFYKKKCIDKQQRTAKTQVIIQRTKHSLESSGLRYELPKQTPIIKQLRKNLTEIKKRKNNKCLTIGKLYHLMSLQKFEEEIWKEQKKFIDKYYQDFQYQEAQKFLVVALSLSRTSTRQSNIHFEYSMIKLFQNRKEQSLQFLNQALQINPSKEEATIGKTYILASMNRYKEAIDILEKHAALKQNYLVFKMLGQLYYYEGLAQKSISYYQRILQIKPDDEQIYGIIAYVYFCEDNFKLAIKYIQKALNINPNNEFNSYLIVFCYFSLSLFDEAQIFFFRSLQINRNSLYFFDLGFRYTQLCDYRRAFLFYSKIQQRYSDIKIPFYVPKEYEQLQMCENNNFYMKAINDTLIREISNQYTQYSSLKSLINRFSSMLNIVCPEIQEDKYQFGKDLFTSFDEKFGILNIEQKKKQILFQLDKRENDAHFTIQIINILQTKRAWKNSRYDTNQYIKYLFWKNACEIHHACGALSQVEKNFSCNISKYEGTFAKEIHKYTQYASKLINFVKGGKCSNNIQKFLRKILSFSQIDLREKILQEDSCYAQIFSCKNEQINYFQLVNEILQLPSKDQKQKLVEKFIFEHFLKPQLLKFIYNQIAFFFTSEKSIQLAELLKQIKSDPQFQLKKVKQHLLRILQWNNGNLQSIQYNLPETFFYNYNSQKSALKSENNRNSKLSLQESNFQSNISSECSKQIQQSKLKFCYLEEKYNAFRKLVMKNVLYNFSFLSCKNSNNHFIVQCLETKDWNEEYFEEGFEVKTKRGDNISSIDVQVIQGIWELGREYVYSWITSIACAIAEIETMGLFHCDIEMRNTVRFGHIFKLIDFDYLFKVKIIETSVIQKIAYRNMIEMIEEFLKIGQLKKQDNIINFLFRPFEAQGKFDYNTYIDNVLQMIIKSKDRAKKIMRELEKYSHLFHFLQFERLVKMMLNHKEMEDVLTRLQKQKIFACLKWLYDKQISFKQFAEEVHKINKKKMIFS